VSPASTPSLSIAQALAEAARAGLDRLDAHLLLGHVLGRSRAWLIAHDEQLLDADQAAQWQAAACRCG
jgi:release factor glutamine methyltransferase